MLSKSISKHDLADDRSVCDIVYSSDDDDDEFGVSQDRRSEYSKSPAPQQQEENHFVQPQFINNFPLVHNPPPVVFANTPFIGLYPYQQPMFNPTFFFRPY
jgi:hypothetical protein